MAASARITYHSPLDGVEVGYRRHDGDGWLAVESGLTKVELHATPDEVEVLLLRALEVVRREFDRPVAAQSEAVTADA